MPKPGGDLEESTERMLKSTGADNNLCSPKGHVHVNYSTITTVIIGKECTVFFFVCKT